MGPAGQLQGMFVILNVIIYELAMYGIIGVECFVDFIRFLIYEVLHTSCLKYIICSAWFLDLEYRLVLHLKWLYSFVP